jgi:hypothetical protein
LKKALDIEDKHYSFQFGIRSHFDRYYPKTSSVSKITQKKKLNEFYYPDCLTTQSLRAFAGINCTAAAIEDLKKGIKTPKRHLIHFSQAVDSELILGYSSKVDLVDRRKVRPFENQKKDIMVDFQCPDQF